MGALTEEELTKKALALGLPLDRARIRAILPEVEGLLEAAKRLRELPISPAQDPRPVNTT